MHVVLKELEPFGRNGQHLQSGKPFKQLGGMRSREALANWLVCATHNSTTATAGQRAADADRLTFSSDPIGGDGIIWDTVSEESWPTEHVMVPSVHDNKSLDMEQRMLNAVQRKNDKGGKAYASGKTLIVFLDRQGGPWYPNRVAKALPVPFHFGAVWVVSLQKAGQDGQYTYGVTLLDLAHGNAPVSKVHIAASFDDWDVLPIQ